MRHLINKPLLALFALVSIPSISPAAVQAIQIRLSGASGDTSYTVPAGKVFILEHVAFAQYWADQSEQRRLFLRHGGTSSAGTIWTSDLFYGSDFNTLFRPLKMPAGVAISVPVSDALFRVYLYGLLVDEADLYASVPVEADTSEIAEVSGDRTLEGTLTMDSPRPVAIEAQSSNGLGTFSTDPQVEISATSSPAQKRFSAPLPALEDPLFLRFSARALVRDEYPQRVFGLFDIDPLNGTTPHAIPNGIVESPATGKPEDS